MPLFRDKETGEVFNFEGQAALEAIQSGEFAAVDAETPVEVTTPAGRDIAYRPEDIPAAVDYGQVGGRDLAYEAQAAEQERQAGISEDLYGGAGGTARAAIEGAASGLTLGLYDVMADGLGWDTEKYARVNPGARLGGEVVGMLAPAVLSGGAASAAGAAAKAGVRPGLATKAGLALSKTPAGWITAKSAKLSGALGGGTKGLAAGQALEGAAYSAVQTTSNLLITDEPLTAEAWVGELGRSVFWGGAIGGASGAILGGASAAGRRMGLAADAEATAAAMDLRSDAGREFVNRVAQATADIDTSVDDMVAKHTRATGGAALSETEVREFSRRGASLRQFGDDIEAAAVEQLKAAGRYENRAGARLTALKAQYDGITELGDDVIADLHRVGQSPRTTALKNRARKLHEAYTKAEVDPTPANFRAVDEALGAYRTKLRNFGESAEGVDVTSRLDELDDFARQFAKAGPDAEYVPIRERLTAYQRAATAFEEAGALSEGHLHTVMMRGSTREVDDYMQAVRGLADELGVPAPKHVAESLDGLTESLTFLHKKVAEVADAGMAGANRTAVEQARKAAYEALGVPAGEKFTGKHLRALLTRVPPEKQVVAVKALDDYYTTAKKFAADTGQQAHADAIDASMQAAREQVKAALGNVDPKSVDRKALFALAGLGALEATGVDSGTPAEEIAMAIALGRVATGKKPGPKGGGFRKLIRSMVARGTARSGSSYGYRVGGGAGVKGDLLGGFGAAAGYQLGGGLIDAISNVRAMNEMTTGTLGRIKSVLSPVGTALRVGISRGPLVGMNVLRDANFDLDGATEPEKRRPKVLRDIYKQRAAEISKIAANPLAAQRVIHERLEPMRLSSAGVADKVEMVSIAVPMYLYSKMPKDPGTMHMLGKSVWVPHDQAVLQWGEHFKGALNPVQTLEDAVRPGGNITPQAAEAVRTLYPELFGAFQRELMQNAPELVDKLDLQQRTRLSILMDVPLEPSTDRKFVNFIQTTIGQRLAAAEDELANAPGASPVPEEPTAAQALIS